MLLLIIFLIKLDILKNKWRSKKNNSNLWTDLTFSFVHFTSTQTCTLSYFSYTPLKHPKKLFKFVFLFFGPNDDYEVSLFLLNNNWALQRCNRCGILLITIHAFVCPWLKATKRCFFSTTGKTCSFSFFLFFSFGGIRSSFKITE